MMFFLKKLFIIEILGITILIFEKGGIRKIISIKYEDNEIIGKSKFALTARKKCKMINGAAK